METNKLIAAVLVAGIAFSVSGVISGIAVHPERLQKSALAIKVADTAPAAEAAPKGPAPIAPLLVSASIPAGAADAKKLCSACHNFEEGAAAKIGPPLYGVVGRQRASYPGFDYSSALKGKPGKWTYEELNAWLYKPQGFAPGTKMGFAGIEDDKERADVIDYLHSLSKNPEPLPTPTQAAAKAEAASSAAGGDKTAAGGGGSATAGSASNGPAPIAALLASASPSAGASDAHKLCSICHNFQKGQGAKIGPPLWGVVGRERAAYPGFEYSAALKGKPGKWTYADLNAWLTKPQGFAPGTKMGFAGIEDGKERADVIDYLHTLADNPEPLPTAAKTEGSAKQGAATAAPAEASGAGAPGQQTQPGPNQNQPQDAHSQAQQPPQAKQVEPAAPGAPGAQGKPPGE